MDSSIRLSLPSVEMDNFEVQRNFTVYLTGLEDEVQRVADPDYEQFLADVWVGIVLTLMVLSCVCCMCSCLLYHKFQQWKRSVLEARRNASNAENGQAGDSESLPSYTIVSGLPSYDEAIEQLRQVRNQSKNDTSAEIKAADKSNSDNWVPQTPPTPVTRLSVSELFQLYKGGMPATPSLDSKT